jgi:hypothetical protein
MKLSMLISSTRGMPSVYAMIMTNILIIIIVVFTTDFDLVPHDWPLKKIAALGMELRVVIWIREFLLGQTQ